MDMERKGLKKEYDYLREEIMHHKHRQNKYSVFVCTALLTLLGGAAVTEEQWITLLGFLIIFPCAMKVFESRYSIALLATYMNTYLEPYIGIQWETNLLQYYHHFERTWDEKIVYRFSKYDYIFYSFGTSLFYWIILYRKIKIQLADRGKSFDFFSILPIIVNQLHNRIAFFIQVFFILAIWIFTCKYYDYQPLKKSVQRNWSFLKQSQEKAEEEKHKKSREKALEEEDKE